MPDPGGSALRPAPAPAHHLPPAHSLPPAQLPPCPPPLACACPPAAKRALEIVRHHDDGFGPATAIAATRYASTLLAAGSPQEAQMYAAQSVLCLEEGMEVLAKMRADGEEDEVRWAVVVVVVGDQAKKQPQAHDVQPSIGGAWQGLSDQ